MSDRRRFFAPVSDSDERTCLYCGRSLPLFEFARDASKRLGHKLMCKACDREKAREYYRRNRERVLARVAARYRRGGDPS